MSAVMNRALVEAIGLDHHQAGLPHILLALLDEERPSAARDVLRALGVRKETIEHEAFRHCGSAAVTQPHPYRGATTDVLWHETSGRAEGFAAALGDGVVRPEQVLLALVWEPRHRWFADVLAAAGATREAVVVELAARGVAVPAAAPPDLPPPKTQAATFPKAKLQELNWALRERAPDYNWGIGTDRDDSDMMIVLAAAHVRLEAVLDDVVGKGGWHWRNEQL